VFSLRLDRVGVPRRDSGGAAAALMHRLSDADFGRGSAWALRATAGPLEASLGSGTP
jgi:hypothetical protein